MRRFHSIHGTITRAMAAILWAAGPTVAQENLSDRDAAAIAEAYRLRQTLGDDVWTGWTDIEIPMLYVEDEHEYGIGFSKALSGAEIVEGATIAGMAVQRRPRTFSTTLAASFDVEGVPAVIIGTPEALEISPGHWAIKACHEMFHVLSSRRGSVEKIAALEIWPKDDASWQLDFFFPYDDVNVMRLMHLQGYPIFLAISAPEGDESVKYNAGTALEALEVMREHLRRTTGDERAAKYAMFQETEEGAGRYTEYRLARLAAERDYRPLEACAAREDFIPYGRLWEESYQSAPFVIKHSGRAVKTRTLFYYTGLGKCLLLDRIKPGWKDSYFAPGVWLDDLIAEAVGARTTLAPIEVGTAAPKFELVALDGSTVALEELKGKVVLVDFWQWWCPPCVEALPHLQKLQETFGEDCLAVLGVSDRVDDAARGKMTELVAKSGASYPMLIDPDGSVLREYGVNSYPMIALVDREGVVRWTMSGYSPGNEREIEQRVVELLDR